MLLTSHPSLRTLPEIVVVTTLAIALGLAIASVVFFLGRSPLLLVRGARGYAEQVAPAAIDRAYVDGFCRLFVERYASWNVYNFRANRNLALRMVEADFGQAVVSESQQTEQLVGMLQNARQVRIDTLAIDERDATGAWHVQVQYGVTDFDGGVQRAPTTRRMDLVLQVIAPSTSIPFCLEILTFTERTIDTIATASTAAAVVPPSMLPATPFRTSP